MSKKKWLRYTNVGIVVTVLLAMVGCTAKVPEPKKSIELYSSKRLINEDYSYPLPTDYEGTITMWGWDDIYYKAITESFSELYPGVKFDYTHVSSGDILQKYQTALQTGTELPDIAWAPIDSRAKIYELDMWEALNKEPYNFKETDVYEYLLPRMKNENGDICGIEQYLSPTGLAYRKDLAREYLGTDDAKELEDMLPDWDSFIEKGRGVYSQSDGSVFMFRGVTDIQQFIREQGGQKWIQDDVVKVSDSLYYSILRACEFRDNKIVDSLEAWSPAWYDSFGEDKHIFAGCANWFIPFVIEVYAEDTDNNWGLMKAPEGSISWGGTTMGITKACGDKRLAWEFIKYASLSVEGANVLNKKGYLTTAKNPYAQQPELKSYKSSLFGEQDLGLYYIEEIIPEISVRAMSYDDNIVYNNLALINTIINNDKEISADEAVNLLKKDLEEALPEYQIE